MAIIKKSNKTKIKKKLRKLAYFLSGQPSNVAKMIVDLEENFGYNLEKKDLPHLRAVAKDYQKLKRYLLKNKENFSSDTSYGPVMSDKSFFYDVINAFEKKLINDQSIDILNTNFFRYSSKRSSLLEKAQDEKTKSLFVKLGDWFFDSDEHGEVDNGEVDKLVDLISKLSKSKKFEKLNKTLDIINELKIPLNVNKKNLLDLYKNCDKIEIIHKYLPKIKEFHIESYFGHYGDLPLNLFFDEKFIKNLIWLKEKNIYTSLSKPEINEIITLNTNRIDNLIKIAEKYEQAFDISPRSVYSALKLSRVKLDEKEAKKLVNEGLKIDFALSLNKKERTKLLKLMKENVELKGNYSILGLLYYKPYILDILDKITKEGIKEINYVKPLLEELNKNEVDAAKRLIDLCAIVSDLEASHKSFYYARTILDIPLSFFEDEKEFNKLKKHIIKKKKTFFKEIDNFFLKKIEHLLPERIKQKDNVLLGLTYGEFKNKLEYLKEHYDYSKLKDETIDMLFRRLGDLSSGSDIDNAIYILEKSELGKEEKSSFLDALIANSLKKGDIETYLEKVKPLLSKDAILKFLNPYNPVLLNFCQNITNKKLNNQDVARIKSGVEALIGSVDLNKIKEEKGDVYEKLKRVKIYSIIKKGGIEMAAPSLSKEWLKTSEEKVKEYIRKRFNISTVLDINTMMKLIEIPQIYDKSIFKILNKRIEKNFPLGKVYAKKPLSVIGEERNPNELMIALVKALIGRWAKILPVSEEVYKARKERGMSEEAAKYGIFAAGKTSEEIKTSRKIMKEILEKFERGSASKLRAAILYVRSVENPRKIYSDIQEDYKKLQSNDAEAGKKIIQYFKDRFILAGKSEKVEPLSDILTDIESAYTGKTTYDYAVVKMQDANVEDLFDNRETSCCAFMPNGANKHGSIGYLIDPDIGLLHYQIIDKVGGDKMNAGVAIMVNCKDDKGKKVLLVDSVEFNNNLKEDIKGWMEDMYKAIKQVAKEQKADYVLFNSQVFNSSPKDFNTYLVKKQGLKLVEDVSLNKMGGTKPIEEFNEDYYFEALEKNAKGKVKGYKLKIE